MNKFDVFLLRREIIFLLFNRSYHIDLGFLCIMYN